MCSSWHRRNGVRHAGVVEAARVFPCELRCSQEMKVLGPLMRLVGGWPPGPRPHKFRTAVANLIADWKAIYVFKMLHLPPLFRKVQLVLKLNNYKVRRD